MGDILKFPPMARKPANKPTENLPNRIREWRLQRGLLVNELAQLIGVERTHLTRMETGSRPVALEWLDRIARHLDVTVADLLNSTQNPYALSEQEKALIDTIRSGGGQMLPALASVADTIRPYHPAPAVLPFDPTRKRA